jgi:tRNA(Ile)-lysidine synthase
MQVDFFKKMQKLLNESNFCNNKMAVAVSGGCDSLALTFLLQQFCNQSNIELFAITVDHRMRPESTKEALQLNLLLSKNKINHTIINLKQDSLPTSNIESRLRELRYKALDDFCKQYSINHLVVGHQLDDIAENFLIRLFRGSDLDGLSPISSISNFAKLIILRPLLDFRKTQLQDFLQNRQISWFEDGSNNDERFLRNKIRNFLHSFSDYPDISRRIAQTSINIGEIRSRYDEELLQYASQLLIYQDCSFLLQKSYLNKIPQQILLKILALVLIELSQKNYKPRKIKLQNYCEFLLINQQKHKNYRFYGTISRNYSEQFFLIESQNNSKKEYWQTILGKIFA